MSQPNNIKDVVVQENSDIGGLSETPNPSLPNKDKPYPGYAVNYPTCSEPTKTNRGCDAWNKCVTRGEGPYNVMFLNPQKRKTATHCRNWMYKLQYKMPQGYMPIDDEWIECTESIANDPTDIKKGTKLKTYKMRIDNVRLPYPQATIDAKAELEAQNKTKREETNADPRGSSHKQAGQEGESGHSNGQGRPSTEGPTSGIEGPNQREEREPKQELGHD